MATESSFELNQRVLAPNFELNSDLEKRAAQIVEEEDCCLEEARIHAWNEIDDKTLLWAKIVQIHSADKVSIGYVDENGNVRGKLRTYHVTYVTVPAGAPSTLKSDQQEYDVEDKNEKDDGTDENTNTPQKNDTLSNQKNDSQPLGINNNGSEEQQRLSGRG